MIKKRGYAVITLLLCFFLSFSVQADALHRVGIRQVYLFQDVLRVYADIDDIEGQSLKSVKKTNAVGYLDQKKLTTNSVKKFCDTGEGVADVFLVDTSKSLSNTQMQQVKAAMRKWASEMKPNDRMAILTFGEEVTTVLDYTNNPEAISKAIESIENLGMKTRLYGAVDEGINLCMRSDIELPKRRNMVLVTDGLNDFNGGVSLEDVTDQLKKKRIPMYCLWLEKENEQGESTMNTLSEISGGEKYNLGTKNIDTVYEKVRKDIQNTFVIDFAYSDLELNGTTSNLELKVTSDGKTPSDIMDTVFNAPTEKSGLGEVAAAVDFQEEEKEENEKKDENQEEEKDSDEEDKNKSFLLILGGILLLLIVAIILIILKLVGGRKKEFERNGSSFDEFDMDHTGENWNPYDARSSQETEFLPYPSSDTSKPAEKEQMAEQKRKMNVLLLDTNTGEVKEVTIANTASVGRKSTNDLVIEGAKVSGKHCVFSLEGKEVYVEDLESTNGTKLNGILVHHKKKMRTGDTLTIADKVFQIEIQ